MIRIRKVDGRKHSRVLCDLHDATFEGTAPAVDTSEGYWWLAYDEGVPVGFSGVIQSTLADGVLYFKRVGVLASHRGQGLQAKLLRACELWAKREGWDRIISDTTFDNIASANSFIRAGYRLFEPPNRWAFKTGLYWSKDIT